MLEPMNIDGRPHWETLFPEEAWPFFTDFRNALEVIWDHLGLPEPTEAQLQIAHRLQYGVDSVEYASLDVLKRTTFMTEPRSDIIRCFRGIGKSYITSAFAAWKLARNPRDEKLLVVSATANKSKAFVSQLRALLKTMPILQWLLNGDRDKGESRRDQADRFDVACSSLSQSPSVRAAAILGQVTGDRATTIIADDIEIVQNSGTEDAREKILNVTREFDAIIKTEHGRGDVIELGTPQTEESVYNRQVAEMGYRCFTIPVKFPTPDKLENYQVKTADGEDENILAYYLRAANENLELRSEDLTDPQRFTSEELIKEEAKGKAYFALQYMLDTSLSDAERYPLRQHDLILMGVNRDKAPITVQWGHHTDKKNLIDDIGNLGFSGDHFLRPLMVDSEWAPYDSTVMHVDPSGRGKDQTAWAIVKSLNGLLFCSEVDGFVGDVEAGMMKVALAAREHKVGLIRVEPNYAGEMWIAAFKSVMQKVWPMGCTIEEAEWAKGQKEIRIIETLEPVMSRHRLIMDESLVRRESIITGPQLAYSLLYQLTHLTRDRGSLKHDDKLDALAGAVAYFTSAMSVDVNEAAQALLDDQKQQMIDRWMQYAEDGFSLRNPGGNYVRSKESLVGPVEGSEADSDDVYGWVYQRNI